MIMHPGLCAALAQPSPAPCKEAQHCSLGSLQGPPGRPSVPRIYSFPLILLVFQEPFRSREQQPPCIILEARSALPHHNGKIGKVPGLLLLCLSQRLQSGLGHAAWQGLIPYPRWPQRKESLSHPLPNFSLPQPSLALNQPFAAPHQKQPSRQLPGHMSCSLPRRKQPSALEDSAAFPHGQVSCKLWARQAFSGRKSSKQ